MATSSIGAAAPASSAQQVPAGHSQLTDVGLAGLRLIARPGATQDEIMNAAAGYVSSALGVVELLTEQADNGPLGQALWGVFHLLQQADAALTLRAAA